MHPSFVNRTLARLHLDHCTFAHGASLLVIHQFQGLATLSLESCYDPLLEQRGPWFQLICGLPSLRRFRFEASAAPDHPSSEFSANAMLSGLALALPLRDQPLDLDLSRKPATRYAPALEDLVRESRGSLELTATQFPTANLSHICFGLEARNCQLQKLHLSLGLTARRERDLACVFEAAQSCRHLQSLTFAGLCNALILDDSACQALSDLLRSSAVLTTLHLNGFSLSLEGFGRVVSGLAASTTVVAIRFHDGHLPPGSLALLRLRLDDVAQLEELGLVVADKAGPELQGFLREASHKLPKLRHLFLDDDMPYNDLDAREAAANACVDFVKTHTSLTDLEVLDLEEDFETQAQEIQFFLSLNRLGRRYLHPSFDHLPMALWPTILARMTGAKHQGVLRYFLRHKPALVRTRNVGMRRNRRGDDVNAGTNVAERSDD